MSKSNAEQIDKIVKWSADNATPVNYDDNAAVAATVAAPPSRRMTTRTVRGA
jgi:hypothetical protein